MNKYKYLLKNIGIMTLANLGTKIISFLMVPLYTNILSTNDYGTYDFYQTTLFLLVPIMSFNIADGIMRFLLDNKHDEKEILSIGFIHYIFACLVILILIIINQFTDLIHIFTLYPHFLFLYFCTSLLSDILNSYARGIEKISDVAIGGVIGSVSMISLNILFLITFQMGLVGYFLANCLSFLCTSLFLIFKLKIWKNITLKKVNSSLQNQMIKYSIPMGLGNIGWWVNNVSDRYIVTWICGLAANGVYSVAYKIPSLLSMFQQIFNQAWTISAVKEYDKDNSEFYSSIYNLYNLCMVVTCSILILFDKVIAYLLFGNEFYLAWKYAPFLMISVVFGAMVQLLGGIFSATKQSKEFGNTIMIGAIVNTILNIALVWVFGPLGAALATALSYMLIWGLRLFKIMNIMKLNINLKRDLIAYFILYVQSFILLLNKSIFTIAILVVLFFLILVLFKKDIFLYLKKIRNN